MNMGTSCVFYRMTGPEGIAILRVQDGIVLEVTGSWTCLTGKTIEQVTEYAEKNKLKVFQIDD